jgi:hypothetical protein
LARSPSSDAYQRSSTPSLTPRSLRGSSTRGACSGIGPGPPRPRGREAGSRGEHRPGLRSDRDDAPPRSASA